MDLRSHANAMNSEMLRQKCCDNKCVFAGLHLQMHTGCVFFRTQVPTLPCGLLCVDFLCVLCLDLLCVLCVDPITSCRTLYRETLLGNNTDEPLGAHPLNVAVLFVGQPVPWRTLGPIRVLYMCVYIYIARCFCCGGPIGRDTIWSLPGTDIGLA